MAQLREMPEFVITTIVIWNDVTAEFNLHRVLHKTAGWFLMDFPELADQICTFLDQFTLGLLK